MSTQKNISTPVKTVLVPVTRPAKKWHQSKVIWFNAASAILLVASGILPMVSTVIPVDTYAIIVGAVNIGLRFFTQTELK